MRFSSLHPPLHTGLCFSHLVFSDLIFISIPVKLTLTVERYCPREDRWTRTSQILHTFTFPSTFGGTVTYRATTPAFLRTQKNNAVDSLELRLYDLDYQRYLTREDLQTSNCISMLKLGVVYQNPAINHSI